MSASRFERAVTRSAARAGAPVAVERHTATGWHSATFSGDRHELVVSAAPGAPLDRWTDGLAALDLGIPGQLLADLRVATRERSGDRVTLHLEGLTVACEVSAPGCGAAYAPG
ncbi:hypothetical protein ASE95_08930 [Sphingomonas sp. Leaf231]|uniref:hypothetical protein n=1 Tax=Sphingomonas sp. Leaf231 TaxID=1736301 RepID=UPI0006F58941|nr:hypothetical protein [Sphingomonas sp. Leaf231]KQN92770.1 hypothetical protein ASE95_08930 [Sphingomonas sp. Leaf231]